jgi:hypothetical protein
MRYELILGSVVMHILIACMFGWIMGESTDKTATYNVISFFAVGSLILLLATVQMIYYLFISNKVS